MKHLIRLISPLLILMMMSQFAYASIPACIPTSADYFRISDTVVTAVPVSVKRTLVKGRYQFVASYEVVDSIRGKYKTGDIIKTYDSCSATKQVKQNPRYDWVASPGYCADGKRTVLGFSQSEGSYKVNKKQIEVFAKHGKGRLYQHTGHFFFCGDYIGQNRGEPRLDYLKRVESKVQFKG